MPEEATRTPGTTGAQDVAVSMAKRIGMLVSGIAIQSLLAYALLPTGRGEYAVCVLFAAWLGILLTPGADAGAQYFVVSKKISVSEGVSVSGVICLMGAGVATALAFPLVLSGITFFAKARSGSFFLALVLVPLNTFSSAMQHHLTGLGRFAPLALFSLLQTATNGMAAAFLLLGLHLGVNGALLAVGLGNLVMIALCIRDLGLHARLTWELPRRSVLVGVLRYGLKYHAARIASNADARVGVLILGVLASRPEVGLFAVASGLMVRFVMISHSVASPLLPRAAKEEGGRPDLIAFCARITTWVTGAALITLLVFSVPVVRFLLSAEFLPIVPLVRIIAPGILVFAGGNVLTSYFRVMDRPEICSWAAIAGLGVNVITVPLLYSVLGLTAAAWGMTAGLFLRSVVLSVAYYRATRIPVLANWFLQRGDLTRVRSAAEGVIDRVLGRSSVRG